MEKLRLILFTAILILVAGLSTTAEGRVPIIDVTPLEYDFEEVELGESYTVNVTISNEGWTELEVYYITLNPDSCQDYSSSFLQLPRYEALFFEPGEAIELEVVYTPSHVGPCSGMLEIAGSDPENPLLQVDLKGTGVVIELAGADYLIITHDNFYSNILPLANAKQSKGYRTKVVKASEIGVNPTADEIADYIRNEYHTKYPKLQYVLLVGDVDYIPTHYRSFKSTTYKNLATDLYYATMDTKDYLPDIAVGRLPVNTPDETDIVVNKILNYKPISNKALLFGGYPEMNSAEKDRINILEPAGFSVDTASGSNATGNKIVTKINQGRFLIAYYGHGSIYNAGQFCSYNIYLNQLTNKELPIVLSGACDNNYFDHPSVTSIGEHFVLDPNGAIAFVGSTREGGYGYDYTFADGFYQELSVSGQIGKMLNAGRKAAYAASAAAGAAVGDGSPCKSFIEKINLLGDPELSVRAQHGVPPWVWEKVNPPDVRVLLPFIGLIPRVYPSNPYIINQVIAGDWDGPLPAEHAYFEWDKEGDLDVCLLIKAGHSLKGTLYDADHEVIATTEDDGIFFRTRRGNEVHIRVPDLPPGTYVLAFGPGDFETEYSVSVSSY
jgi:hypothetical protein